MSQRNAALRAKEQANGRMTMITYGAWKGVGLGSRRVVDVVLDVEEHEAHVESDGCNVQETSGAVVKWPQGPYWIDEGG
jgi:hypothetical protein